MTLSRLPKYYWDIFYEYITGANKPYTGPVATEEELMESRKNAKYILKFHNPVWDQTVKHL